MFKKILVSFLCLTGSQCAVQAQQNHQFYTVVSAGYAESNTQLDKDKGAGYRIGVGYELGRQWYLEVGYQQIIDESAQRPDANTVAKNGVKAGGGYLTLLGKASGAQGELFYRIGALSVKVEEQQYRTGTHTCAAGIGNGFNVGAQAYTDCRTDNTAIAGVIGFGYDTRLSRNILIRTEIEHIKGQDDIEFNAAYVGIRYNF